MCRNVRSMLGLNCGSSKYNSFYEKSSFHTFLAKETGQVPFDRLKGTLQPVKDYATYK